MMFQAKTEQLLGHNIQPIFVAGAVMNKNHILRVGLQIYFSPSAEGKEGLQGAVNTHHLYHGGGPQSFFLTEELMGSHLSRHLLIG